MRKKRKKQIYVYIYATANDFIVQDRMRAQIIGSECAKTYKIKHVCCAGVQGAQYLKIKYVILISIGVYYTQVQFGRKCRLDRGDKI